MAPQTWSPESIYCPLRPGVRDGPYQTLDQGWALSDLKAYMGPLRPESRDSSLRPGVRDGPSDLRAYMDHLRPGVREGPSQT